MASSSGAKGAKTRHQNSFRLKEFIGPGKEFDPNEIPTLQAVIQRGILFKEIWMIEEEASKKKIQVG